MAETDVEHNAKQIIADANDLARRFYRRMGYAVPEGYRFDKARHPQEQMCWAMVADAVEHLTGTELQEVLDELENEG
jgi:hypothetical protein